MWRFLVGAVLLYIMFDFADLMMPGAVNFDPDQSVDGVYGQNLRADGTLTPLPHIPRLRVALNVEQASGGVRPVRALARLSTRRLRPPRAFLSESRPSSSDDH
jgi:hypothetical protein